MVTTDEQKIRIQRKCIESKTDKDPQNKNGHRQKKTKAKKGKLKITESHRKAIKTNRKFNRNKYGGSKRQ